MDTEIEHSTKEINKDDFRILKVIGRGSFGKVFLVRKTDNQRLFAMKTLKKENSMTTSQYMNTKCNFY